VVVLVVQWLGVGLVIERSLVIDSRSGRYHHRLLRQNGSRNGSRCQPSQLGQLNLPSLRGR